MRLQAENLNPVSFKADGSFGSICVRVHIAYGNSSIGCKPLKIPSFHALLTFSEPFIFWAEFFMLGLCQEIVFNG